jgi:hypothetical protein
MQFLWQQLAADALGPAKLRFHTDELTKQPCLAGAMNLPARHGEGSCQPLSFLPIRRQCQRTPDVSYDGGQHPPECLISAARVWSA